MNRDAKAQAALWLFDRLGFALWSLMLAICCALSAIDADASSVVPVYRAASHAFVERLNPYTPDALAGFLYLPAFAVAYFPFAALGAYVGDTLWRVAGFTLLTYAAWRQLDGFATENRMRVFSLACFLALPLTAGAVRNGQSTILLLAAVWLLLQAAARARGVQAFAWAAVSLVAKPTAVVAVLLAGAVYPAMIGFLAAAIAFVAVLPFFLAPMPYVLDLYREFAALLVGMQSGDPTKLQPSDVSSLLNAVGVAPGPGALFAIRAVGGIATLAGALALRRKIAAPGGVLAMVVLTVFYLSVFNPRQELNTYAVVALPFCLSVALWLERTPRSLAAAATAVLLFALGMTGAAYALFREIAEWLYPLGTTVAFVAIMAWAVGPWSRADETGVQPRRGGME